MKEFADDNFEIDENGRKFPKEVKKNTGKSGNFLLQTISPLPGVF